MELVLYKYIIEQNSNCKILSGRTSELLSRSLSSPLGVPPLLCQLVPPSGNVLRNTVPVWSVMFSAQLSVWWAQQGTGLTRFWMLLFCGQTYRLLSYIYSWKIKDAKIFVPIIWQYFVLPHSYHFFTQTLLGKILSYRRIC